MAWYCPKCGKGSERLRGPAGHYCDAIGAFSPGVKESGPKPADDGPGTELAKLLLIFRIKPNEQCNCKPLKKEMNRLGVDGCERELDRIVRRLQDEAENRGWWFAKTSLARATARMLVRKAINNARR